MASRNKNARTNASHGPDRRQLLKGLSALGIGSAVFQRALAAQAQQAQSVTAEMIKQYIEHHLEEGTEGEDVFRIERL